MTKGEAILMATEKLKQNDEATYLSNYHFRYIKVYNYDTGKSIIQNFNGIAGYLSQLLSSVSNDTINAVQNGDAVKSIYNYFIAYLFYAICVDAFIDYLMKNPDAIPGYKPVAVTNCYGFLGTMAATFNLERDNGLIYDVQLRFDDLFEKVRRGELVQDSIIKDCQIPCDLYIVFNPSKTSRKIHMGTQTPYYATFLTPSEMSTQFKATLVEAIKDFNKLNDTI